MMEDLYIYEYVYLRREFVVIIVLFTFLFFFHFCVYRTAYAISRIMIRIITRSVDMYSDIDRRMDVGINYDNWLFLVDYFLYFSLSLSLSDG